MVANGSCLCGKLCYRVQLPVKWVAHCHCSLCRKAHGAAFVSWFGIDEKDFKLLSAQDLLSWYSSSADAQRGFCSNCGSSLFFKSSRWPGELHLTLANMLDDMGQLPKRNAFYNTRVSWNTTESLPCYHEDGSAMDVP